MPDAVPPQQSLTERLMDHRLAVSAVRKAVRAALLRHKQAGVPIGVWQDGSVVWLPPERIPTDDAT